MSDEEEHNGAQVESRPTWFLAELTYRCPLQCPYCSNAVDYAKSFGHELTTAQWISVFQQARELGAVQLGLSGGEPCLRPDLEELIAEGRRLGFYSNLITSAFNLDAQRIANFRRAGLDSIQVSFQGTDKGSNDLIAGTECFEKKVRAAKEIKAHGYCLVINFVVHRFNIHQVNDLLQLADSVGANYVEVANCQYHGWAFDNKAALLPTRAQLVQAEQEVKAFRERQERKMPIYFVVPDYFEGEVHACANGWGTTMLSVTPTGDVLPCHGAAAMHHIQIPNVKEARLFDIWHQSELFNSYRGTAWMKEPCVSCPDKERDLGGCRCQALMLTGDASSTDPCCPKAPEHKLIVDLIAPRKSPVDLVRLRTTKDKVLNLATCATGGQGASDE